MADETKTVTSSVPAADAPPAGKATQIPALSVFSPTLRDLSREEWPPNLIACMQCPNAVWMKTGTDLKCYCRVMYRITWSKADPMEIVACDGTSIGQEEEEG